MNLDKSDYVRRIREDSAYPVFRRIIGVVVFIACAIAALILLMTLILGLGALFQGQFINFIGIFIGGTLYAALIGLMARVGQEAALMLADLADSTMETNTHIFT